MTIPLSAQHPVFFNNLPEKAVMVGSKTWTKNMQFQSAVSRKRYRGTPESFFFLLWVPLVLGTPALLGLIVKIVI